MSHGTAPAADPLDRTRFPADPWVLKEARFSMDEAKKKLNMAREITFDKFRTEKAQYIMEFVEEEFPELKGGEA